MKVYGPTRPLQPGIVSVLKSHIPEAVVVITSYGNSPQVGEMDGMKIFAGPRDAPFFFAAAKFQEIADGISTEFDNSGIDEYAGKNIMAVVVEVPKSELEGEQLNVWVESKILK